MMFKLGGHLPDPHDASYRDFETQLRPHLSPGAGDVDLREFASKRHNQGQTSSCVAQAVVKALENLERQHLCRARGIVGSQLREEDHTNLSVMALYYLCRAKMNRVQEDCGTYVSLACDRLRGLGVCTEKAWPFDTNKLFEAPDLGSLWDGSERKIRAYYRITQTGQDRVNRVIDALRANHPVVYATEVGDNWDMGRYQAGQVLQLPDTPEGGHATHLIGWDDTRGVFLGENSWGELWGDNGFYFMAPEVIAHESSSDFWVITGTWEVSPQ